MLKTINSNLLAPISLKYNEYQIDNITLDIDRKKKLYSIPFALYDEIDKKYIFINTTLKNKILPKSFINSQFYLEDSFENVSIEEANKISILLRVAFYQSGFGINKSNNTNNLIKFKLERNNNTYITLYAFVDYGIPDPIL